MVLLCAFTVVVTLVLLIQGPSPGAIPQSVEREYVGFSLEQCLRGCDPAEKLAGWEAAHPRVHVLEETPVRAGGLLVGHWVAYREETL